MRYYLLGDVQAPRSSGYYTAEHGWGLPGVHCPVCEATWSSIGDAYPTVDLSQHPEQEKYSWELLMRREALVHPSPSSRQPPCPRSWTCSGWKTS